MGERQLVLDLDGAYRMAELVSMVLSNSLVSEEPCSGQYCDDDVDAL